jgi:protein-S-isoprenylcysteine O-methyltransferase Ste14
MKTSKPLIAATVVAGVALLVVAGIYFADSAGALPSFFPGHQAGSSAHHVKHGIAAVVVALALFAFAWLSTGPRKADAGA